MNIKTVSIYAIKLPFKEPFRVSYETYKTMPTIIIKLETEQGLIGYGEGVPDEHVTGETWASTYQLLKHTIAPALIGVNPFNIEKIHEIMDQKVYHAPTAKAAIDIACYDVIGKATNQPIFNLIGGRYHEKFKLAHVLSIQSPQKMAEEAAQAVDKGYSILKMKVGINKNEDIERVKAVREMVGSEICIRVDANQGWKSSAEALYVINQIAPYNIDWVEQPVLADDIDALVDIKSKSNVPLMIDEGLKGQREMREVVMKRAVDSINIKLMKCGGIYPAMKLVHQAEMAGMTCQIGSMLESSIGSAAGYQLAFSKKNITSVELTGPLKFSQDVGNLPYQVPFIQLENRPGLGIDINEAVLEQLTEMHDVIGG